MNDQRSTWLASLAHTWGWSSADIDRLDALLVRRGHMWSAVRTILDDNRFGDRRAAVVLLWLEVLGTFQVEVLALFSSPFPGGHLPEQATFADVPVMEELLAEGYMADVISCWYRVLGPEAPFGYASGLPVGEVLALRDADRLDGVRTLAALRSSVA